MKKLIYLILGFACLVTVTSCTSDEDEIFDKSANERLMEQMRLCEQYLTSAPNGWIMEYYAGTGTIKMGGYNLLCSFDDGKVTVMSELEPGRTVSSFYRYNRSESVVLTFDTYNELIHYFSEPQGSSTTYQGDYEFTLINVTENEIEMKGKKFGNKIVLTRLPGEFTMESYLDRVFEIQEQTEDYNFYQVYIGENNIGTAYYDEINRTFEFTYQENNVEVSIITSVITTSDGFKFYQPVYINNVMIDEITWDNNTKNFSANNITLINYIPEGLAQYDEYLGNYYLRYINYDGDEVNKNVSLTIREQGRTYTMTNPVEGYDDFLINYSKRGTIQFPPQHLNEYQGYPAGIYYQTTTGIITGYLEGGYEGTFEKTEEGEYIIRLRANIPDDSIMESVIGFVMGYLDSEVNTLYFTSEDAIFQQMRLIKR